MSQARERGVLGATYVVLATVGALSGVIECFLVPQRLFGGVEGLSVALVIVGNIAIGSLGGIGTGTSAGAIVPVVGWFSAVVVLTLFGPGGDVILPGRLPQDPGVVHVTSAFLIVGILAGAIPLIIATRYTKRVIAPTETA